MLNLHREKPFGVESEPPDPGLEDLCMAQVSLIRPHRKGRKVFETLDQEWLEESVSRQIELNGSLV